MKRKRNEQVVYRQNRINTTRQEMNQNRKNTNQVTLDKAGYNRLDRYSLLLPNVILALFLFCAIVLVLIGIWHSVEQNNLPSVPVEEKPLGEVVQLLLLY